MFNFCWHTWSSWSRAYAGYDAYGKTQYSKCKKCNAMKSRKFKTDQCINIEDVNTATSQPDVREDYIMPIGTTEAVAQARASIDGKDMNDPDYYDGYMSDASELIDRINARGYEVVKSPDVPQQTGEDNG